MTKPKPTASPKRIAGATIDHVRDGAYNRPVLIIKGAAPAKGSAIEAEMPNGSIYSGTVTNAVKEGAQTALHFRNGLTPKTT